MHETAPIDEDFAGTLSPRWMRSSPGGGTVSLADSALRLTLPGASRGTYSNAQIDDYSGLPASRYPWRPPLRLEVRARASHPVASTDPEHAVDTYAPQRFLHGTAGFGFWNYPLTRAGGMPRLPDAIWFFAASPPSNMALVPGTPGWGWKAQVIHAHRWQSLALAAPTAGSVAWARLTGRAGAASRWVRQLSGAREAQLDSDLRVWHDYSIEWRRDVARFSVDGAEVLMVPFPPRGPLGFVTWIDNQYAIATPRGAFGFGTLRSDAEWLELAHLRITPFTST